MAVFAESKDIRRVMGTPQHPWKSVVEFQFCSLFAALTTAFSALKDLPSYARRDRALSVAKLLLFASPATGTMQKRDDFAVLDFDDFTAPGTFHCALEPDCCHSPFTSSFASKEVYCCRTVTIAGQKAQELKDKSNSYKASPICVPEAYNYGGSQS